MIIYKPTARSVQPIGLDIGHDSIKMIQLASSNGRVRVLAAERARMDPSAADGREQRRRFVVLTIKQILARGGFRGRNVVSSLPSDVLKITSLRLAESEAAEIEKTLEREAAQRFGLDPEKDSIKYMSAGSVHQGDETKNELILFAASDESIKTHISMLEEAGLTPVSIDTVPCALFRNHERLMRRQEDKQRTAIFVDVGGMFTTVVFARGGEICFVKQIPVGAEKFNQQVAAKLNTGAKEAETLRIKLQAERLKAGPQPSKPDSIDAATRQVMVDAVGSVAEELTQEISLCLRYHTVTFRGKRVQRAILTGGGAYEPILLDVLRRRLQVEVDVAEPLTEFDVSSMNIDGERRGPFCEWAVAAGLSLKGLSQARQRPEPNHASTHPVQAAAAGAPLQKP